MSIFQQRIKELMLRDGISQRELANLSSISESSISRYISGALTPRMDILVNISKVFNVSTSYLTGESDLITDDDAYDQTIAVVTRNRKKLSDSQKADIIKILFGGK